MLCNFNSRVNELKIFAEIKIPLGVFHRYKFSRTCRTMFEINRIASVSVIKLQAAITTSESKFRGKAKESFSKAIFLYLTLERSPF